MDKTRLFVPPQTWKPMLSCFHRGGHDKDVWLEGRQTFGRESEAAKPDISMDSFVVSRNHGEFAVIADQCFYRDADSANGTWINGKLYGRHAEGQNSVYALQDGDILSIRPRRSPELPPDAVILFTTVCTDQVSWSELSLTREMAEIVIGRSEGDLKLPDACVSSRHASFFRADKGWAVLDHDSTNGVYVNNVRITEPVYLTPMDLIRIAGTVFFYNGSSLSIGRMTGKEGETSSKEQLSISIEERNVWARFQKKTLLKDISLQVDTGDMVLILGGSGAGKTTFMNAVMGYEKAQGKIYYGNTDIYEAYEQMKYEIGFVPQQDLLRGTDTVFDTLYNAALMRMPSGLEKSVYLERVEDVMELLGLERERDSLVVKLSGGQRKRLSIATEFVGDPKLFFLDEPDSGLDGIMARNLMENLRTIADRGKIVMVITHGPDRAADLFNKVVVLAKSMKDGCGYLAFYGNVKEAYRFFETDSLEQIVRRINHPSEGGEGLSDYFIETFAQGRKP